MASGSPNYLMLFFQTGYCLRVTGGDCAILEKNLSLHFLNKSQWGLVRNSNVWLCNLNSASNCCPFGIERQQFGKEHGQLPSPRWEGKLTWGLTFTLIIMQNWYSSYFNLKNKIVFSNLTYNYKFFNIRINFI